MGGGNRLDGDSGNEKLPKEVGVPLSEMAQEFLKDEKTAKLLKVLGIHESDHEMIERMALKSKCVNTISGIANGKLTTEQVMPGKGDHAISQVRTEIQEQGPSQSVS